MTAARTIEDRLREEYFDLLPDVRRVAEELEAEVRHCLLPVSRNLDKYERLVVKSRIKECESAVDALRRREEPAIFDADRSVPYTLTSLKDLAGVRVLAFPRSCRAGIDVELRRRFSSWTSDPVPGAAQDDEPLALKYFGYCQASDRICGEYQIVPMLTGLFWEVEHAAIYKPTPQLKGVARHPAMQARSKDVVRALEAFEAEYEQLIRSGTSAQRS